MNDSTDKYNSSVGELIDISINNKESFLERFPLIKGVKITEIIDVRLGRDHVQVVFINPPACPCNTEIPIEDYLEWAEGVI